MAGQQQDRRCLVTIIVVERRLDRAQVAMLYVQLLCGQGRNAIVAGVYEFVVGMV